MFTRLSNPIRKTPRLAQAGLTILAVMLLVAPGVAAGPQPKSSQQTQIPQSPEATCPSGGQCFADVTSSNPFYWFANRLYQQDIVTGYACGGPWEPCDAQNRPYYRPGAIVSRQQMAKFIDQARSQPGILIATNTEPYPLRSITGATNGTGVFGSSAGGRGVEGTSNTGTGVRGHSNTGIGVLGSTVSGWAGFFQGHIYVSGNCTGCAGPTKIDHPLDPENKYLYHSTVQSPDMKNVYDGVVTLDANGEAEVVLPDWFEALNEEFRYQLTTIGGFAPVFISEEISGNHFKIAGGSAHMKVSWQVTGVRHDPYAEAHHVSVEEDKPADEKGKYLHPTEWGQPESKGVDYAEQQKMREQVQHAGER